MPFVPKEYKAKKQAYIATRAARLAETEAMAMWLDAYSCGVAKQPQAACLKFKVWNTRLAKLLQQIPAREMHSIAFGMDIFQREGAVGPVYIALPKKPMMHFAINIMVS